MKAIMPASRSRSSLSRSQSAVPASLGRSSPYLEDYEKASPVPPHPPKTSTTESTQSGYLSATSGSQFSNLASAGIGGSVKFRKSKGKRKATDASSNIAAYYGSHEGILDSGRGASENRAISPADKMAELRRSYQILPDPIDSSDPASPLRIDFTRKERERRNGKTRQTSTSPLVAAPQSTALPVIPPTAEEGNFSSQTQGHCWESRRPKHLSSQHDEDDQPPTSSKSNDLIDVQMRDTMENEEDDGVTPGLATWFCNLDANQYNPIPVATAGPSGKATSITTVPIRRPRSQLSDRGEGGSGLGQSTPAVSPHRSSVPPQTDRGVTDTGNIPRYVTFDDLASLRAGIHSGFEAIATALNLEIDFQRVFPRSSVQTAPPALPSLESSFTPAIPNTAPVSNLAISSHGRNSRLSPSSPNTARPERHGAHHSPGPATHGHVEAATSPGFNVLPAGPTISVDQQIEPQAIRLYEKKKSAKKHLPIRRSPRQNELNDLIREHYNRLLGPNPLQANVTPDEAAGFNKQWMPDNGQSCAPSTTAAFFRINIADTPSSPWNTSAAQIFTQDFIRFHKLKPSRILLDDIWHCATTRIKTLRAEYLRSLKDASTRSLICAQTRRWGRKDKLFNIRMTACLSNPWARTHAAKLRDMGVLGMSSDESDHEEAGRSTVVRARAPRYYVRIQRWRHRSVGPWICVFDVLHVLNRRTSNELRGSYQRIRIREELAPRYSDNPRFVVGLSISFYDEEWLGSRRSIDLAVQPMPEVFSFKHNSHLLEILKEQSSR